MPASRCNGLRRPDGTGINSDSSAAGGIDQLSPGNFHRSFFRDCIRPGFAQKVPRYTFRRVGCAHRSTIDCGGHSPPYIFWAKPIRPYAVRLVQGDRRSGSGPFRERTGLSGHREELSSKDDGLHDVGPAHRSRLNAALIRARCVNACGKLPSASPLAPVCSE